MPLYDCHGHRKYLTPAERAAFLHASESFPAEIRTFCGILAHTGSRISEALAVTADRVDLDDAVIVFESLKKRRKGIFRAVPVPPAFLESLDRVHNLRSARSGEGLGAGVRLWPWSRSTGWRLVRRVMAAAGIVGLHATAKGLRHGFGIKAVVSQVPLNLTRKWLGHARIETTAIYADAIGPEEKRIAQFMWT